MDKTGSAKGLLQAESRAAAFTPEPDNRVHSRCWGTMQLLRVQPAPEPSAQEALGYGFRIDTQGPILRPSQIPSHYASQRTILWLLQWTKIKVLELCIIYKISFILRNTHSSLKKHTHTHFLKVMINVMTWLGAHVTGTGAEAACCGFAQFSALPEVWWETEEALAQLSVQLLTIKNSFGKKE